VQHHKIEWAVFTEYRRIFSKSFATIFLFSILVVPYSDSMSVLVSRHSTQLNHYLQFAEASSQVDIPDWP
jgi:hypothetical protein